MRRLAYTAIIVMAMIWGSTFFSIKALVTRIPVSDMLALRFTIAAVILALVGIRHWRMSKRTLRNGILLGIVWGIAQLFQTFGIDATTASLAGFITGLAVVITPLIAAGVLREKIELGTWAAVILATVGLGILSLNLSGGVIFGYGETLTLISSVLYAMHIVMTGHMSTPQDAITLAMVQTPVTALICWIAAVSDGRISLPVQTTDWMWLLYLAIIAGALTIFLQIWAQAHVESTRAAIIMATEPVWAAILAVAFGGEVLTARTVGGGFIIVAAMVLAILSPAIKVKLQKVETG